MKRTGGKSHNKNPSAKAGKKAGGDSNVAAVFDLGFLGSALRSGHYACGERLQQVRRCLDELAEVIQPNVFIVLRDLLTQLTGLQTEICQSRTASIRKGFDFLSRWLRDVRGKEGANVSELDLLTDAELKIAAERGARVSLKGISSRRTRLDRYRKWIKLSTEFGTAAWRAVPTSSIYYCWFRCGYFLGDWINEHALIGEHSSRFSARIEAFQQSALELPPQFLTRAPWLNRLAKYKFRENTAIELSKLLKDRVEPSGTNGEHHDYQLQLTILYYRIVEEVLNFEGACILPPAEVGGTDDKGDWISAKDAIDFAMEFFDLDLNYNEISRRSRGEKRKFHTRPSKSHAHRREVHLASFVLYLRDEKRKLKHEEDSATSGDKKDEDEPSNEEITAFLRRKEEVDKEHLRRLRDQN